MLNHYLPTIENQILTQMGLFHFLEEDLGLYLIITVWQVLAMTQVVKIIFNRDKASFTEFLLVLLTLTPWIVIERFL